jgi:hypothetical protein
MTTATLALSAGFIAWLCRDICRCMRAIGTADGLDKQMIPLKMRKHLVQDVLGI